MFFLLINIIRGQDHWKTYIFGKHTNTILVWSITLPCEQFPFAPLKFIPGIYNEPEEI